MIYTFKITDDGVLTRETKYHADDNIIRFDVDQPFKIPDGVVKIDNKAFRQTNLVSVGIPNSVTSIDYHALSANGHVF